MGRFKKKQLKKRGKQKKCQQWPRCRCVVRGLARDCPKRDLRSWADQILHP